MKILSSLVVFAAFTSGSILAYEASGFFCEPGVRLNNAIEINTDLSFDQCTAQCKANALCMYTSMQSYNCFKFNVNGSWGEDQAFTTCTKLFPVKDWFTSGDGNTVVTTCFNWFTEKKEHVPRCLPGHCRDCECITCLFADDPQVQKNLKAMGLEGVEFVSMSPPVLTNESDVPSGDRKPTRLVSGQDNVQQ